ncbi:hypothetical protein MHYP_G00070720 [Metynnis hypsauchen]
MGAKVRPLNFQRFTWEQFDACRKTDLLLVADFFSAIVPRSAPKQEIKTVLETHLVRLGILPERERSLGVALGHTPGAEAAEVADGSEHQPRMDPGGALSPGLDPLLAVQLRELELKIKIQEREAEALRLCLDRKRIKFENLSMGKHHKGLWL